MEETFAWAFMETAADIHQVPVGDHGDHFIEGRRCWCQPEIVQTAPGSKDMHGYPVHFVIQHRPWVWRACVPDGMPEDID